MKKGIKYCLLAAWLVTVAPWPSPAQIGPTLQLSLKQAVEIALGPEGNARVQLAEEMIRQAQARSAQSRAALLPDFEGSVGQQNLTRNLAAFGIRIQIPVPGFHFPELVGPFNVFDARATVTQNILDFSSIRRYQASRTGVELAKSESESTRSQVTDQVARAYLAGLRAEATFETAKANVELSDALLKLALNQKAAGTGTGIEVTRSQVQLANERQRLLVAENERERAHLELLRVLGLKLKAGLELTDKLSYVSVENIGLESAIQTALQSRPELKAQQRREENARLNHSAVKMERLPSLVAVADYGSIGSSIEHAFPTRTFGASLRVPVLDGGRRDARRAESLSQYRQERIRTSDLREQIELDIRLALDALRSAEAQVKAAEEGLSLAENELAQARRRYQAGVASGLEVTDAQTRLERARENRIAALFNHNLARIDLGTATGTIQRFMP